MMRGIHPTASLRAASYRGLRSKVAALPERIPPARFRLCLWLFVLFLALSPSLAAQEGHWQELTAQVVALHRQGKNAEAIPLAQEALRVAESTFGPEHPAVATSLNNLAIVYRAERKYAEAEPLYLRALVILEKTLGPDDPLIADGLNNLAVLYRVQERYADAEPYYKELLALRERTLGPNHPDLTANLSNLATVYVAESKYADAEPLFQRALAVLEKAAGNESPRLVPILEGYADLLRRTDRAQRATELEGRARAIRGLSASPAPAPAPSAPEPATSVTSNPSPGSSVSTDRRTAPPAPAPVSPAPRAKSSKPPAVSVSARFAVQAGVSSDRAGADVLAAQLAKQYGLTAQISTVEVKGRTLFRVRLPAQSRAEADKLAASLLRDLKIQAWIVPLSQ